MEKPKLIEKRTTYLDYHDIIKYVEDKYKIETRDYFGTHGGKNIEGHYNKFIKLANDPKPKNDDIKLSQEHYQRYKEWCKTNPEPPYCDYWHWLLEHSFNDVYNPCTQYWNLLEILENEDNPEWVLEITQKIHDEFKEYLDKDGCFEVYISW